MCLRNENQSAGRVNHRSRRSSVNTEGVHESIFEANGSGMMLVTMQHDGYKQKGHIGSYLGLVTPTDLAPTSFLAALGSTWESAEPNIEELTLNFCVSDSPRTDISSISIGIDNFVTFVSYYLEVIPVIWSLEM